MNFWRQHLTLGSLRFNYPRPRRARLLLESTTHEATHYWSTRSFHARQDERHTLMKAKPVEIKFVTAEGSVGVRSIKSE